ncbi:MAG: nucleoside monophosphate kinase [Patescibacteria group bacterium]
MNQPENKFQAFILMGRSASGKGTQAVLLRDFLKQRETSTPDPVLYIETGANFREYIKADNYSSGISRQIMTDSGLQPAFLANWLWADLLIKNYRGEQHWVVDGTPRTLAEALTFDSALKFYGFKRPTVVLLDIPNDIAHDRLLKRGRFDDLQHEGNEKRLAWFETEVMLAVDLFRQHQEYYRFVTLDGTAGIEVIHKQILALV